MGAYRFSMAPNISVPRSKFKMPFNHVTSFNHGKLVPVDCFEILPGDEFHCNMSAVIRMSTPIAPVFGNIKAHVHAFFIPMRLVWEHTKEFYGENKTAAGYQQNSYSIPSRSYSNGSGPVAGSVSSYLGKPCIVGDDEVTKVSILKERCYYLTWNEYYRAQQLQNPVLINLGDTGAIGTITSGHGNDDLSVTTTIGFPITCMNVCKEFDYFTACTTAPQYGSAVTLPLGTSAPVGFVSSGSGTFSDYQVTTAAMPGVSSPNGLNLFAKNGTYQPGDFVSTNFRQISAGTISGEAVATSLVADLQNATAASINSIRYAFQVQKWLERANFGSRFFEMLNLHYGVTSPDARLQRPEYLGGFEFYINVDQVIATATATDGSGTSNLGQTGAVSVTGVKGKNLFNKAFVEPGYVMVMLSTTQERSYAQGFLREDLRSDRFDFYFPEFANLGDQLIKRKEIFAADTVANDEADFGYQEHWAEYRYRANRVSGILNPNVANSLDYWTLGEKFTSAPTLGNSFIMETRDNLQRALTTGSSGPDYIADLFFDYTAVREMPLYTIPGLVDHFGTM